MKTPGCRRIVDLPAGFSIRDFRPDGLRNPNPVQNVRTIDTGPVKMSKNGETCRLRKTGLSYLYKIYLTIKIINDSV